jgi:hypothetical protein
LTNVWLFLPARGFFKRTKPLFSLELFFQQQQRGSMPNDNLTLGIERKLLVIPENDGVAR